MDEYTAGRLSLTVPALSELGYRQALLSQPDTMSYNRGYQLDFPGYDSATGCIAFPKEQWADWYARWVGREPERYYAYLCRKADGVFVGEADLYHNPQKGWYEMGVVLEARHRGAGYGREALALLMRQAFEKMGAQAVHNDFERSRAAALRIHLAQGFRVLGEEGPLVQLLLTREEYFGPGGEEK